MHALCGFSSACAHNWNIVGWEGLEGRGLEEASLMAASSKSVYILLQLPCDLHL